MKEMPLTRGLVALVDDADYEWLSEHKWTASKKGYAIRVVKHPKIPGKRITVWMHRLIMGLDREDPREVDHWDENKANNQRRNLRIANQSQNQHNRGAYANNKSGYKGVSWYKNYGKWRASIKINGVVKFLGYFDDPKIAHEAYCAAARVHHGEFANLGHGIAANSAEMFEAA